MFPYVGYINPNSTKGVYLNYITLSVDDTGLIKMGKSWHNLLVFRGGQSGHSVGNAGKQHLTLMTSTGQRPQLL